MLSRRLQNVSMNTVEHRGWLWTSVETTSANNCRRLNELAPEVARHQSVSKRANQRFDSRRLHHSIRPRSGRIERPERAPRSQGESKGSPRPHSWQTVSPPIARVVSSPTSDVAPCAS